MPLARIKDDMDIFYLYEQRQDCEIPVIFTNGSIFNHRQWFASYLHAFRELTNDSYSYVLYDYQGIGQSSPRSTQFTLQELADELFGLLNHLKIERVHLFGVSKGTMVNQVFSGLHPDRVASIGGYGIVNLLAPGIDQDSNLFSERLDALRTLSDIIEDKITSENFKRVIRTVYTPAIFSKQYSELGLKQKFIHWVLERRIFPLVDGTPIKTMELLFSYYVKEIEKEIDFYASCLQGIGDIPVLLLSGTEDKTTPIDRARDLTSKLNNVKFVEFEGFEHITPNLKKDQGKSLMKEYVEFLSSL
jgi:pimeloyl-ACP methyl ester carboxylesterase